MSYDVPDPGDALVRSFVRFGHVLRGAGIAVTPAQIADLTRALGWIDIGDRTQVFETTRALLVTRREDLPLFAKLFDTFFALPADRQGMPRIEAPAPRQTPARGRLNLERMPLRANLAEREREVADRRGTYTDVELLRSKRFAAMTPEELDEAARLMQQLRWRVALRRSRRRRPARAGRSIDFRRVLRAAARHDALPARLPRQRRIEKQRPIVLIADISGSMERYARLVLQFFHTVMRVHVNVETFVFATRLSRITPQLRLRDVDRAIEEAARDVIDWAGGTRIGASLRAFNREWSRRVLRRGAVVAVISDGCDRGDVTLLRRELRWLQRRCHRLIWLNPHLRHPEYRPLVQGMAAALDHIDDFLPADDLDSLAAFAAALARLPAHGTRPRRRDGQPTWS